MRAGMTARPAVKASQARDIRGFMLKRIFPFMAAALCGVTALAYLAPYAWWIDLIPHFRQHLAVAAMILAVIFVAQRRRAWALACGAALLAAAGPLFVDISYKSETIHDPDLRILSWNVLHDQTSPDEGIAMLRARDADILILSETSPQWRQRLQSLADTYPYQRHADSCDNVGCQVSLLSKRPWLNVEAEKYVASTPPVIWAAYPGIDGGPPFRVIAVHVRKAVTADGAMRQKKQVTALGKLVRGLDGTIIMAGDMNAAPSSAAFRRIVDGTGLEGVQISLLPTWPTVLGPFGISIDHFFKRGPVRLSVERLGSFGSDHMALEAAVSFR
jgi:endonuclease/exonuclease/phosphatase (EEP) superfamily protein YafD